MSQTITWYDSVGHYRGSGPPLPALWGIGNWAQRRSVHSVKCTYACGGRLLTLAAGSRYEAGGAPRTPSSCLMSTMESSPLHSACCGSTLRRPVEKSAEITACVLCSSPLQYAPLACTHIACVCAWAFRSFCLCFPEIQSLIVVTRKIPKPSTRLTSGSVLIASSLSNTHKTVGQDSQRTCDVRPAHCPGICVLSCAFHCL